MGMTIWLNIRNGSEFESFEEDRSAICDLQEQLEGIAAVLKVPALSDFYDDTDARYNMDETGEFGDDEEGWPAEAANWFAAEDVLASANAILAHLLRAPGAIVEADGWDQAAVIDDLTGLVADLELSKGKEVHLSLVM